MPERGRKRRIMLAGARLVATGAVIFSLGIGLGTGIGFWLDDGNGKGPESYVALNGSDVGEEAEYTLPVRVFRSEKALNDYLYEEPVGPETTEHVVRSAPPVLLPRPAPLTPVTPVEALPEAQPADPATAGAPAQLARLPSDGPTQVPVLRPADQPLWLRRALPFQAPAGARMIAVVIDDVGIDQKRSQRVIALPGPLTISFITYGRNMPVHLETARRNGHEIMLHLPMEPENPKIDPGPNALMTGLDAEELQRRLEWGLSQFGGYVGINNHMGSKFTAWTPGMELVMREVKRRGLLFMDSVTSRQTVGFRLARAMEVPHTVRDIFLDHDIDAVAVQRQLTLVEETARRNGHAIAIGHPHDVTTDVLREWLPGLAARGFTLVPVSTIVKRQIAVARGDG